jgi:putative transcriptional regulator
VRKIIPVTCVVTFLMSFGGVDIFITQADPHLKALLGVGLLFFVWLLILWDDLLQPERPAVGVSHGGPAAKSDRPVEALLGAFAAGTLSEPFAVLVASHLQMKAVPIPAHRERQLARVGAAADAGDELSPRRPMPAAADETSFMPLALRSYVSRHLGTPQWRTILPGIKQCQIARDAHAEASLLRCRPGSAIPAHTHAGLEAVLVLQGGFSDQTGHYACGDVAVADHTTDHRPVADRAAECIIFIVLEAPVRLTGPFGRLIQRVLDR